MTPRRSYSSDLGEVDVLAGVDGVEAGRLEQQQGVDNLVVLLPIPIEVERAVHRAVKIDRLAAEQRSAF